MNNSTAVSNVIPFHSTSLLLVEHDGQPFVPMKPVVEGMGLAWQTQHRKLVSGRFASVITMMVTTGFDGKQYEMACLPLKKLPGWLMSIHASKVRKDLRGRVIAFQDECDDVLWLHWNKAHAPVEHTNYTLIGTTIGSDGFHCLSAVIDGKLSRLDKRTKKSARMHIWSQVHKAFSVVSAQDIPAEKLDAARNFVAAYVLEGKFLPRESALDFKGSPHSRYLLSLDEQGRQRVELLPHDTMVMNARQFIKAMSTAGDAMIPTEQLLEFMAVAVEKLRQSAELQAARAAA
ncbi:hypothetical protein GIW33_10185 [Pseudomonas syringae]|nr:hypothetical protein [Pseudomonas syringae]